MCAVLQYERLLDDPDRRSVDVDVLAPERLQLAEAQPGEARQQH